MSVAIAFMQRFFAWWFGELAACVPAILRGGGQSLLLRLGETEVRLVRRGRGREREIGLLPLVGAGPDDLARLVRRRTRDTVVELAPGRVLRCAIDLPLAARENLREVIGFELDRYTPLQADEAAYDFRVLGIDRRSERVRVDLAVAGREQVDAAVKFAVGLGLTPSQVVAPGDDGVGKAHRFNFLAPPPLHGGRRLHRRVNLALAAAVVALMAAAAWLPIERKREVLAARESRLAEARAAAVEVGALRTALAEKLARSRFLVERRADAVLAMAVLAEVTSRLPDDTWLVQFRLSNGEVALAGYSQSATQLIAALENSPLLADARFSAPVEPDPQLGLDRFNLAATVAAGN